MALKLNSEETTFRNELIFAIDAKAVNMDNVLLNLFMLLNHNGVRPKQRATSLDKGELTLEKLKNNFLTLEKNQDVQGFATYPHAAELWLRSNLVNMVNRGNPDKEKISSLRPIHLESYRLRNAPNSRDYNTADQLYSMLGVNTKTKEELKSFLAEGWDRTSKRITNLKGLDVDSLGILTLIKDIDQGVFNSIETINHISPLLKKQAELFCEDINCLLAYKRSIPRNVLLDYLKTLVSFHLSIYLQKLIYLLPKMIQAGTTDVPDDWSVVLDVTGKLDSKVSMLAIADAERMLNSLYDYIRATFKINAALKKLGKPRTNSNDVNLALNILKNPPQDFEPYFQARWDIMIDQIDVEDREWIEDFAMFEPTYFAKYIELVNNQKGNYQYRYHFQLIDNLAQKNSERGFIAQGRTKKNPRRFVLGTRLLETLVQILLLKSDGNKFTTQPISIEDLTTNLRTRYGLIINGVEETRFETADLNVNLAFKENVEAFKNNLRQIGFYNVLSDAYIMQKIRPRYEL
ncbi:hypothetical protein HQ865_00725 [Mucilaginibacter mali]|uniref:Uncharacterized protein n=1 Tax=Mucilaginibacter mali TaxID=2740462 RepID=A0A7D4UJ03_9SPHI|nr:hypothetical protein [Mucilaginibacter mali]QKJ28342.1 hypothetical protein HQ865_00725 [Mucilaginibacter mali]